MGTVCAPSYANLFMVQLEEKHIYMKGFSLFIIWKVTKQQLITFINNLNKKRNLDLNIKISSQKTPFLDTVIYK